MRGSYSASAPSAHSERPGAAQLLGSPVLIGGAADPSPAGLEIEEADEAGQVAGRPGQPFVNGDRRTVLLIEAEVVDEELAVQPARHLDLHRPGRLPAPDFREPVATGPGDVEPAAERFAEQAQRVEDRGLATAVRPHQSRHRGETVELDVLEHPVVPDPDPFDAGRDRHDRFSIKLTNSSNSGAASCGPAAASGWYCTENAGTSKARTPSTVLSFGQ